MSVFNALHTGIYNKLTGGTALTALLAGTASIYYQQAPDGAILPYVVFNSQGGGPDNTNASDMRDMVYHVRGYANSPALAGSVDAQISSLLHRGSVTVSGYTNFWLVRETDTSLVENPPDQEKIHMAGGIYRIRLTA